MSWISQTFSSTIGRKVLTAVSGFFLIIFLIGHVSGNLLLFYQDEGQAFNMYANFMTSNQLVQVIRYLTYISIIVHIVYSIGLTIYNRKARPVSYAESGASSNSSWTSRNMAILGTLVLLFLVLHLSDFWYYTMFGELEKVEYDTAVVADLYSRVVMKFSSLWYVLVYVTLMVFLGLHLSHGFYSAFQTMGWRHPKYTPVIKTISILFAILVPALFASMPVYIYLQTL